MAFRETCKPAHLHAHIEVLTLDTAWTPPSVSMTLSTGRTDNFRLALDPLIIRWKTFRPAGH
jgi:hypothetical protein